MAFPRDLCLDRLTPKARQVIDGRVKRIATRVDRPVWAALASALVVSGFAEAAEPEGTERRLADLVNRPGGLTSDEVAARTAATSTQAAAERARVATVDAEIDRVKLDYYPRLTLTGRYTRLSPIQQPTLGPGTGRLVATTTSQGMVTPDSLVGVPANAFKFPVILNQYFLQANVTVPISDYLLRTSQSYAAASRSKHAAELNEEAARLEAALRGRLAYYAWVRAELSTSVAAQALNRAQAHRRLAQVGFDAGRLTRADVLRAESQVANAELLLERARQTAEVAEDQIRTLMHDTSQKDYRIGEDPLASLPPGPQQTLDALYREALRKRAEIRALDETEVSLKKQEDATQADRFPRLEAFGNAYYANPNQRFIPNRQRWNASWDVGVQVTWSPNDFGQGGAQASSLEAKRAETEAKRASLRDSLRQEIFQALSDTRSARVAIETGKRSVSAAEEAYRARSLQFEQGRATTVELVDAETELLRARLDLIDAHVELRMAHRRLEHAVGRDRVGGAAAR